MPVFTLPLVTALATALVLAGIRPPQNPPQDSAPAAVKSTPYDHTAVGAVLRANGGRAPASGEELVRALKRVGDFTQLPVTYSAVNPTTSLTSPRIILAPRPGGKAADAEAPADDEKTRPGGLGLPVFQPPKPVRLDRLPPISTAKATEPNVEGRLFFAANFEKDGEGKPRVKTIEFISWNSRKKRFDFGVIECGPPPVELQILDGVRCFSCHKNKGPILGQGPWSNTMHNDVVRTAALQTILLKNEPVLPGSPPLTFQPGFAGPPFITPDLKEKTTFDGLSVVFTEPETCDAAVRQGSNLARDREVYRAMAKTPDGRKALIVLLAAIASPLPIEQASQSARQPMDLAFNINSANFAQDFAAIQKATPDTLLDFSPSGSSGTLRTLGSNEVTGWGGGSSQRTDVKLIWGGDLKTVRDYESKRSGGETGMPSARLPSNPRAFVRAPLGVPPRPSAVANATSLARLIGLTEGDRKFMADSLQLLANQINKPKVTAATLARDVFNAPSFMDGFKVQEIPDREEFKDRFAAAVGEVAKNYKLSELPPFDRALYASGPAFPAGKGDEKEEAVVPTTACLRCHDVRGVGKPAFNPIPMLAFDPFDKPAREAWARTTDVKKRAEVLGKFVKRLATDQDMPPEDSPEYEKFRGKEKASFEAVREWIDAEWKRAKGE